MKVMSKVTHISTVITSQTLTDTTNSSIANAESCMWSFDWHLHLTLSYSKGQCQGHAHYDCECLANGGRYDKHTIANTRKVAFNLSISILA